METGLDELPLLSASPPGWAKLAANRIDLFLADHAGCEQQAALSALSLADRYMDDQELVDRLTSLAMEEIVHYRKVVALLRSRKIFPGRKKANPWVKALLGKVETVDERWRKADRLLVGALIEARSCERFTRLLEVTEDEEVKAMLTEFGPAEARHWRMFYGLAGREVPAEEFERRWKGWLEFERELTAGMGKDPRVHG